METNNYKQVFSKKLTQYIEKENLTTESFAEAIGFPEATVLSWIRMTTYPRMDKVQKIADFFGICKSELIENCDRRRFNLSREELELIENFRRSNDDGKNILLNSSRNIQSSYPIATRKEKIDYLKDLPVALYNLNIVNASSEELYALYRIVKDKEGE